MNRGNTHGSARSAQPPQTMLNVAPMREMLSCEALRHCLTMPDLEQKVLHPKTIDSALFLSSANLLPSPSGPVYAAPTYIVEAIDWLVVPLLIIDDRWLVCTPLVAPTTIATTTIQHPMVDREHRSSSIAGEHDRITALTETSKTLQDEFGGTSSSGVLLNPERVRIAHARGPSLRRLGVIAAHANETLSKVRAMVQGKFREVDDALRDYHSPLANMSTAKVLLSRAVFDLKGPSSNSVHSYLISIAEGGFCLVGAHVFETKASKKPNLAAHFLYAGLPEMTLPLDTSPGFARVEISETHEDNYNAHDNAYANDQVDISNKNTVKDGPSSQYYHLSGATTPVGENKSLSTQRNSHQLKISTHALATNHHGKAMSKQSRIASSFAAIKQFLHVNGSGTYSAHHVTCLNVPSVGSVTVNDIAGRRISSWICASRAPSAGLKTRLLYEFGLSEPNPTSDAQHFGAIVDTPTNDYNIGRRTRRQRRRPRLGMSDTSVRAVGRQRGITADDFGSSAGEEVFDPDEIEEKSSCGSSHADKVDFEAYSDGDECDDGDNVVNNQAENSQLPLQGYEGRVSADSVKVTSTTLECQLCQARVQDQDALECHFGKRHSELQLVRCRLCSMRFSNRSNRSRHEKSVHSGVKPHICNQEGCGKAFSQRSDLKRHRSKHEKRPRQRTRRRDSQPGTTDHAQRDAPD